MIIAPDKRIAFIMSPRLGDSLISMVVVHNLQQQGYNVAVYGDYIFRLKGFFPNFEIYPSAMLNIAVANQYDITIAQYRHDLIDCSLVSGATICINDYQLFRHKLNMVEVQIAFCKKVLKFPHVYRHNGLSLVNDVQSRQYFNRIIIHSTASDPLREWSAKKFISLAHSLQKHGYDTQFIVSPDDRMRCQWIIDAGLSMPQFASLFDAVKYIAESGWFIGNDSGIGHLASNLGIPTVTIAVRPGMAHLWRPDWSPGIVCLPIQCLLIRSLKEKYWRQFLSVAKVEHSFNVLRQNSSR